MALQGTLDTFALPDVLRLLATTHKSGRLLVQGDTGNGSLYLDDGSVVGGETSFAPTDEGHEVLFELLRLGDGSFLFDPADTTESPAAPVEVEEVIVAAEASHTEWEDLSTVIPSLDVGISLSDDLPADTATVDRDRWRLIVGIGSGTTVRALGSDLGFRELPILRATRGMVDDGLAVIGDPTSAPLPGASSAAVADDSYSSAAAGDSSDAASSGGDPSTDLPTLGDNPDAGDMFEDPVDGISDLPEPLPDRGGAGRGTVVDPFVDAVGNAGSVANGVHDESTETATSLPPELETQLSQLSDVHRQVIDDAAVADNPDEADHLLDELPDGAIDRDLLRRFLGSVRT